MQIRISQVDGATPILAAIAEKVTKRRPLNAALGKRGEIELRAHFERRNAQPNKKGWPKQEFWNRIRTATALAEVTEDSARVVIADPAINQKIFGGTITPKEGKFLAIPAIAAAYGKSPRIFDFLQFIANKRGGARLVDAARSSISFNRKGGVKRGATTEGGTVYFWLVRKVTQSADANALPGEQSFSAALLEECKSYLDRITAP